MPTNPIILIGMLFFILLLIVQSMLFSEKRINAIEEFVCQQTHDSLASQYKEINSQFLKTIHFLITECNASELEKIR